jgi:hypothetical protein
LGHLELGATHKSAWQTFSPACKTRTARPFRKQAWNASPTPPIFQRRCMTLSKITKFRMCYFGGMPGSGKRIIMYRS